MKRWLAIVGIVFVVLIAAVVIAAKLLVDGGAVRGLVVDQASAALGRPVQLGELDLVFFPQPAVRLASLDVAGDPGGPPLLTADEIRLRIALAPLFQGRVVLAAVELVSPSIRLPVDAEGNPQVPELGPAEPAAGAKGERAPPRPSAPEEPPGAETEAPGEPSGGGAVSLAIEQLSLENGSLEAGPWRVTELQIQGELDLEGESRLTGSAVLPELGQIQDIDVTLRELLSGAPAVDAEASIDALDLAALGQLLALTPDPLAQLAGLLSGKVRASLRNSELGDASGELDIDAAQIATPDVRISGDVPIRFALGGEAVVDLTACEVVSEPTLRKPAGERLSVTAELGRELGVEILRKARLALGPNEIPVTLALAEDRLTVQPTTVELGPIAPWFDLGGRSVAGTVRIAEPVQVTLEPLGAKGTLTLDAVRVPLEQGEASLSGPILAQGQRIRFDALEAKVGNQPAKLAGGYDLEAGKLDLDLDIAQADVEAMIVALTGSSKLSGTLGADFTLSGAPSLEALQGAGTFSIAPGQIKDFSLLEQVLGPLAQAAEQALRSKGKDLSKYEQETFELLEGKFALANGTLNMQSLALSYRYGKAELRGTVGLLGEQPLSLKGTITLAPEVASDVLDRETDEPLVLPDLPVGGTIEQPRVQLDARFLASVLTRVAAQRAVGDRLGEKLEEKLGSKEEAEAIKGVIEGILGGRREQ